MCKEVFIFLGKYVGVGLLGYTENECLNFIFKDLSNYFPNWPHNIALL